MVKVSLFTTSHHIAIYVLSKLKYYEIIRYHL